jgi:NAD(P)-dependent dehydrogenase (short-subunit alcohol dehydrogenase family)
MATQKVAIVTAAGSGMGAAAARKLAADGYRVAILSSSGKGEALAGELGGIGVTGSNQSIDDLKKLTDLAYWKFQTRTGSREWKPIFLMSFGPRGWLHQ